MTDTTPAVEQAAAAPKPAATTRTATKSTIVTKLLTRARGATVAEVQAATGWQPHSVRAFLSGLRKAGRTLVKEERKTGETSYRLATVAVPAAEILQ